MPQRDLFRSLDDPGRDQRDALLHAGGAWVPATNLVTARFSGEMRGRNGTLSATPAVQFANDLRSPMSSPIAAGAAIAADGMADPSNQSMTTASTSARFCRVGFNVSASGATLSTAGMAGMFEFIRGT